MKTVIFTLATLISATLGAFAEDAPKDEALILATLLESTQNNATGSVPNNRHWTLVSLMEEPYVPGFPHHHIATCPGSVEAPG